MPVRAITYLYSEGTESRTPSSFLTDQPYARLTLPANYWQVGMIWRITATGVMSSIPSVSGGARFILNMGAGNWDLGALPAARTSGADNVHWWMKAILVCRTIGTAAVWNAYGTGYWLSEDSPGVPIPSIGPGPGGQVFPAASVTAFDSTIPLSVYFSVNLNGLGLKWTMEQYLIEEITP